MRDNNNSNNKPQAISELIKSITNHPQATELDIQSRAQIAWSQANGDKEARYTSGVWLKEPTKKENLPTLIVYIENNVMLADFQTNHEIYAMRLERIGFPVSKVEFKLSRYKKNRSKTTKPDEEKKLEFSELSIEQLEQIEEEIKQINSPILREKARKASIRLTQWEIAKSTQ